MPEYPVLVNLNYDRKLYPIGSTIELSEDEAVPLLDKKVLGEPVAAVPSRPNAADAIKLIESAETLEELEKAIFPGEDRKTVLEAFEKRKAALSEAK